MSQKREWLVNSVASVPSIIFLALWRGGWGLEFSGWIGSALAAIVLVNLYNSHRQYNPILLGINIHLLIITPLIMALFYLGEEELSKALLGISYRGVLITVFLVGCILTISSKLGFIGNGSLPASKRCAYSVILLVSSAASIAWVFTFASVTNTTVSVAIPMVFLFSLRRILIARWNKRNFKTNQLENFVL